MIPMLEVLSLGLSVTLPLPAFTVPVNATPAELTLISLLLVVETDLLAPIFTVPVPWAASESKPPAVTDPLFTLMEPLFAVVLKLTAPDELTPEAPISMELLFDKISDVDAAELNDVSAPVFVNVIVPPLALREEVAVTMLVIAPEPELSETDVEPVSLPAA